QVVPVIEGKTAVHNTTAQTSRELGLASNGLEILAQEVHRPSPRLTQPNLIPEIDRLALEQHPGHQIGQMSPDISERRPLLGRIKKPGRPAQRRSRDQFLK